MDHSDDDRRGILLLPAVLAGWLAYLAVDFLTHAVVLAPWWQATQSYWLQPGELFRRIPFAYGAFAIYVVCIVWLVVRILGPRPRLGQAIRLGAVGGMAFGAASGLATYSVFSMPVSALIVWPASATLASAAAAAAGGSTLGAARPWRRMLLVLLGSVLLLMLGVVLQNLFSLTPAAAT